MNPIVELIYFEGCPHVALARANVRQALSAAGLPATWQEWKPDDNRAPKYVALYGSPTVLVNGRDVSGHGAVAAAAACRTDGAPSLEMIQRMLSRSPES